MKTRITLFCLLVGIVAGCKNPTFILKNEANGSECGPYLFAHGQRINVQSGVYVLQKRLPPDRLVKDRMEAIVIPEVDFRDADVRDIVSFLRTPDAYFSPADQWQKPPVDIVLVIPKGKNADVPNVTLEANNISLFVTAKMVAKLSGLDFSIHDGRAWLEWNK